MKLEFPRKIFEKSPYMKFHENPTSGSRAKSRFSKFCERSQKRFLYRRKQAVSQLFFWHQSRESGWKTCRCNGKYFSEVQYSLCIRPVCLQISAYSNVYKCIHMFLQFTSQFPPTCTPSSTFFACAEHHGVPERSAQKQQHRSNFVVLVTFLRV